MKKLIVLLVPFILTGCVNGNRDFETVCEKKEKSEGFNENISYKIYSNSDNLITKIIETYELTYDENSKYGKSAFEGSKIAINSYGKSKKYDINVLEDKEDKYIISFTLDISNLTDEELKNININRDFPKQKSIYSQDMTCGKK